MTPICHRLPHPVGVGFTYQIDFCEAFVPALEAQNGTVPIDVPAQYVAQVGAEERSAFLRRVYQHVAGALALFIILEALLQSMPFATTVAERMSGAWLLVILGFWVVGWISARWTLPGLPLSQQYLGLGLYVVAEAIIFMPMIAYVRLYEDPNVLPTAGILTATLVVGLTMIALDSRTNFSVLRGALFIMMPVAFGLIIASLLFGIGLGGWSRC